MAKTRLLILLLVAVILFAAYHRFHTPAYLKYYHRALLKQQKGEYEKALLDFDRAAEEAQEIGGGEADEIAFQSIRQSHEIKDVQQNRPRVAADGLLELAQLYPHHPQAVEIRLRAGTIYQERVKDLHKALLVFHALFKDAPDHPETRPLFPRILKIYMVLGEDKQVVVESREFLDAHPAHPAAPAVRFLLGEALSIEERWEEAVENYLRVLADFPQSEEARLCLFEIGNALVKLEKYSEALTAYEKALTLYPNPDVVKQRIRDTEKKMKIIESQKRKPVPVHPRMLPDQDVRRRR